MCGQISPGVVIISSIVINRSVLFQIVMFAIDNFSLNLIVIL